ncbi:hypothetical protein CMI37_15945 [Candidatus Pacearchaeota archaeon]|nr:hypothetical protein [Candidatus Pacearchaeota archaeon]|tara:strand:- start:3859 stop:4458 length:600 start_codon:yes stop_codon:yes gene_type:complete
MNSNMTWDLAITRAHRELIKESNTRELGKIRQHANEHAVQQWLDTEEEWKWPVYRHEEMTEEQFGQLDHNCAGWDILEPISGMRIQAKYRAGKNESNRWHMEQTRRTTGSNTEKSHNGQVRYEVGEFDVMVFTSPENITNIFSSDDLIAIPTEELRDIKKPGFLVGRAAPKLVKKWRQRKAIEVIREVRDMIIRRNLND